MWIIAMSLLSLLTLATPALAERASCTTRYDKAFEIYRTQCSDGRTFVSKYDRAFDRWRTEKRAPWKKVEPKGKNR